MIFNILLTLLQVVLIQHVMAHLVTSRTTLRDLKEKLSSVNQLSSNEVAAFLSDSRLSRVSKQNINTLNLAKLSRAEKNLGPLLKNEFF